MKEKERIEVYFNISKELADEIEKDIQKKHPKQHISMHRHCKDIINLWYKLEMDLAADVDVKVFGKRLLITREKED